MLALIGGSGLSSLDGFEPIKQNKINTIFGETSACLNIGKFAKKEIVFLPVTEILMWYHLIKLTIGQISGH